MNFIFEYKNKLSFVNFAIFFNIGFSQIDHNGAAVVVDNHCPSGHVFFLNTKFFKLVIDSETDFITTPFIEPENQTAKTAKVLFMGNTTCSNLRKQGVGIYLYQSITS